MRLNVEEKAFNDPRLFKFAQKLTSTGVASAETAYYMAVGSLCVLWHKSQSDFLSHVTREQVDLWLWDGAAELLVALTYLKPEPEGLRVSGNEGQLSGLMNWRAQKKAAGKRSAESRYRDASGKWKQSNDSPTTSNDSPTTSNDSPTTSNDSPTDVGTSPTKTSSIQFNSIQYNSIQELNTVSAVASLPDAPRPEMPKKRVKKEKPEQTDGSRVWAAYVAAMEASWRITPPRSAQTAAQAKKLAEMVGAERACQLAAYYPTRRSQYYLSKGHPFGLILSDHMALLRECESGIKFTPQVVKRIVDKEETETSCQVMQMVEETNPLYMDEEQRQVYFAHREQTLLEGEKP
jgi:hypothetical protein